jgi:hypothetical protein
MVRDKMFGHFVLVDDAADRERNLVLRAAAFWRDERLAGRGGRQ